MTEHAAEIEVTCPECGEVVRISEEDANKKMKATCKKGHEIPLAKAIGG
jgi:hypothetical protein